MVLQPSRRDFVRGLGIVSVTGLAGCSANSSSSTDAPRQYLYVRAINETEKQRYLRISIVDGDELLVQQDIQLPAIGQRSMTDTITLVSLGRIPKGKEVTVKAVLHGEQTQRASAPLTLDCIHEDSRNTSSVSVIVQEDGSLTVTNENGNSCYRGTIIPSGNTGGNTTETES